MEQEHLLEDLEGHYQLFLQVISGAVAIKEALNRTGVKEDEVDEVIVGTVLQAGQGQIPSRQAATKAGLPWSVKNRND